MLVEKYFCPESVSEAIGILHDIEDSKILAGGTDLNISIHERRECPKAIVDISHINELKKIVYSEGMLHIGSMCTFSQIEKNELVKTYCPMLAQAASMVGSPQIRNLGTVGGNLANAATAADTVPAFMAMDAQILVMNSQGERYISVKDVPVDLNKTSLNKDELIIKFIVRPTIKKFSNFEKIGRRKALAISRINMGMVLDMEDGNIKDAAIAYGAIGKTAYRMQQLESFLKGKNLTTEVINEAADMAETIISEVLSGRSTMPYKKKIGAAVLRRSLEKAMGGH